MSGRRQLPSPPDRQYDQYRNESGPRRNNYSASSRYDAAPSQRRSPSPRRAGHDHNRSQYRDDRGCQNTYRSSERRRDDAYTDSRASRAPPTAYEKDRPDRDRTYYASDRGERIRDYPARRDRRSISPRRTPPPPSRSRREASPPPPLPPLSRATPSGPHTLKRGTQDRSLPGEEDQIPLRDTGGPIQTAGGGTQDEEEDAMAAMMGFGGFGTTKNKKVSGNEAGAAEIKKERTWRQYMNRKGGFNRPLDKIK